MKLQKDKATTAMLAFVALRNGRESNHQAGFTATLMVML